MKKANFTWIKNNGIYVLLFIMTLLVRMRIEHSVDDLWYANVLDQYNLWDYLYERYFTWAGRMIPEAVGALITHWPIMVWRVVDSLIYVGIAWMLGRILGEANRYIRLICCTLWMTYPYMHMNSAGYVITTVNYTWPLFFVLVCVYLLKELLNGRKLRWWEIVLNILCLLYPANTEQGAAVLFGTYFLVIIYYLFQKKKAPIMVYVCWGLTIAALIFFATCPGISARLSDETALLFPEFEGLSFIRKLEIGVTSGLYHFVFLENTMYALFTLVLWRVSRQYARCDHERVLCAVPFVLSMCFSMFSSVFYSWFPDLAYFRTSLTRMGTLFTGQPATIFPCLVYAVTIAAILYCLYLFSRENWLHTLLLVAFIALGFGARVMLGFSASIWASSDRTYMYMYTAFIMSIVYMLNVSKNERLKAGIFWLTVLTGLCSYISLMAGYLYLN
ncbi:MAG: hypothetical protein IJZ85_07000 [Lachnospiraceae bacterium]|nr:hypothetical protein [Lachnospiraceae bacterium]